MAKQFIATANVGGLSAHGLVDRKDGRGRLVGIAVAGGIGYHYFRVVLDGHELANSYLSGILSGPAHGNTGFPLDLEFKTDILVEVSNRVPAPQTMFWASYTFESNSPAGDEGTIQTQAAEDGIDHVFRVTETSRLLLGPARSSYVHLTVDMFLPGETISGRVALRTYDDQPVSATKVPLLLRPAGKTRVLDEIEPSSLGFVDGDAAFEISSAHIDEIRFGAYIRSGFPAPPFPPFALELVAPIPGFANYPSLRF